jgi:hypothetical protein
MGVGTYVDAHHARHALAQIWNGSTWRVLKPPGGNLYGVSCSASWFCMASGGPTGAENWNGHYWREMPSPKGGVYGVSCGSRSWCAVVDGGVVRTWNGSTWKLWSKQTSECGGAPGPCGLAQVACGSATNCVGVGTMTVSQEPVQNAVSVQWNGRSWSRGGPPAYGNPAGMNAVSCAGSFCMATGGAFTEVDNGGTAVGDSYQAVGQNWTDVAPDLGTICSPGGIGFCYWASTVACASSSSCMTLGEQGLGGMWWNGTAWQSERTISARHGSGLQAISCAGSDCMAVGYQTISGIRQTLAEVWNGTSWSIISTPKLA